jgi:hypothetical protein
MMLPVGGHLLVCLLALQLQALLLINDDDDDDNVDHDDNYPLGVLILLFQQTLDRGATQALLHTPRGTSFLTTDPQKKAVQIERTRRNDLYFLLLCSAWPTTKPELESPLQRGMMLW